MSAAISAPSARADRLWATPSASQAGENAGPKQWNDIPGPSAHAHAATPRTPNAASTTTRAREDDGGAPSARSPTSANGAVKSSAAVGGGSHVLDRGDDRADASGNEHEPERAPPRPASRQSNERQRQRPAGPEDERNGVEGFSYGIRRVPQDGREHLLLREKGEHRREREGDQRHADRAEPPNSAPDAHADSTSAHPPSSQEVANLRRRPRERDSNDLLCGGPAAVRGGRTTHPLVVVRVPPQDDHTRFSGEDPAVSRYGQPT